MFATPPGEQLGGSTATTRNRKPSLMKPETSDQNDKFTTANMSLLQSSRNADRLHEIGRWAMPEAGEEWPKIGQIEVPDTLFPSCQVQQEINEALRRGDGALDVLFICSELEARCLRDTDASVKTLHYGPFLDALRGERAAKGAGPDSWKPSENCAVPSRVVLVVSLEPHMSAECALALIAAMRWSFDLAKRDGSCVRLLTLGPELEVNSSRVRQLVGKFQPADRTVESFQFRDGEGVYLKDCVVVPVQPGTDVASAIRGNYQVGENETGVVVCFPPARRFPEPLGQNLDREWDRRSFNGRTSTESVYSILTERRSKDTVIYPPSGARAPVALTGDHIHIVLSTHSVREFFHPQYSQYVEIDRPITRSQRFGQLSWARQAATRAESVHVYVEATNVKAYVDGGALSADEDDGILNLQMSGFHAALCELAEWGMHAPTLSQIFIPYQDRRMTSLFILCRQGIFDGDSFKLRMSEKEASAFVRALPEVKYDSGLAYFVTLPSPDEWVATAKVQLAALLTVGLDAISLTDENGKLVARRDKLVKSCWGMAASMARRAGGVWLALGQWMRAAKMCDESWQSLPEQKQSDMVSVDRDACQEVSRLIGRLDALLRCFEYSLGSPKVRDQPSTEFTAASKQALEMDLLRASITQLSGMTKRGFIPITCTAKLSLAQFHDEQWIGDRRNTQRLEEDGVIFGIHHGLVQVSDDEGVAFDVKTWTRTSMTSVVSWQDENCPGKRITDVFTL